MKNKFTSYRLSLMAALIWSLGLLLSPSLTLGDEDLLSNSTLQDSFPDKQAASVSQSNSFSSSPLSNSLGSSTSLLPVEQAFRLIVSIDSRGQPELLWTIQEDYYLYKDQLSFSVSPPVNLVSAALPEGEHIHDEFYGDVEIYQNSLAVPLVLDQFTREAIPLNIQLQGCAKGLYCYPLQEIQVSIVLDPVID